MTQVPSGRLSLNELARCHEVIRAQFGGYERCHRNASREPLAHHVRVRNGNERLRRLRELLPAQNAIVGVDLANVKQAAVVTNHDSRPGRLLPGPDSVPASLATRPSKAVSETGETERCGPPAREPWAGCRAGGV
jgi:hypothetical protein